MDGPSQALKPLAIFATWRFDHAASTATARPEQSRG
jgi:hypothetical protein